jgi:superfamily I DNA and/or RNA helicase
MATVGPLLGVEPVRAADDIATTRSALVEFYQRLGPQLALLAAREVLLGEWQQAVSGATEQLYPELIRYADVVGATCIGAASRREIAEEQFDLAIIDEAGQIPTTDVLLPLVRARRAVLVGDHRQLPPIADNDVLAAERDPAARELVRRSALENLVGGFPASHKVMLTGQRRMPKVIADFVSEAFYGGRLETMVTRTHDDVVFSSPLAFVDTSDQPMAGRRERRAGSSIENEFEADLLAALATHYQRQQQEWALIVPYRAQLKLIGDKVLARIPDQTVVDSNIGTVDSFQGGERDVVIYGFTRSNPGGQVGFLDELRRANVAFTRAKRQLVLVGDLEMLVRADSAEFRQLMGSLREHVRVDGDLRPSTTVRTRLDELAGRP